MNPAQIHLALNHAPLFFSLTGALILAYAFWKKNDAVRNLAYYFLVAGALCVIPVYLTGEGTEELVEKLPGVSENAIEEHQEWAKITLAVIGVTGLVALVALFTAKMQALARMLSIAALLLSLASFGSMAQTAHLGGLIRHTELGQGAAAGEKEKEEKGEEDKPAGNVTIQPKADSTAQPQPEIRKKDDDD